MSVTDEIIPQAGVATSFEGGNVCFFVNVQFA